MSKKSGSAGKRVKKKQPRVVKRKTALAPRPTGAVASHGHGSRSGWRPAEEGIEGLVARLEIHYHEAAHHAAEHAGVAPDLLPPILSTPARVAALATPDLLARLGALGVATDREAFLVATAGASSALRFAAERWLPLLTGPTTVHDRDFVRLAACELWSRFRPEAPSVEGLLDLFQRGFAHARRQEEAEAVEVWLDFWARLRPRLSPELGTLEAVNAFFGAGFTAFDDWIELLLNATEDTAPSRPELVARTVTLLEQIHHQLSKETDHYRSMLVEDRAGLLFRTGSRAEGERIFRELIALHPTDMSTYLTLSGYLALDESEDRGELAAALALLEEAVTKREEAGVEWALDMRIAELRDRIRELDGGAA